MSNKNRYAKAILLVSILLVLIIPFTQIQAKFLLFLIMIFYIFAFALINPKMGLFLIILARPCLDIFTNNQIISLYNISLNLTSIFGFLTIILVSLLIYQNRNQKSPITLPWLLFLGISMISIHYSIDKTASLKEIIRLISIFFVYLGSFYIIKKNEDYVTMVKVIIFSAILPGILAIFQYITKTGLNIPLENIYNRIYGTFAHPNLFAYYLVVPITLAVLIFLIGKKTRVINIIILLLSIIFVILLGLTFTRGAWLAFVLIIFIIGILRYRFFLISAMIVLALSYAFIKPIHTRVDDLNGNRQGNSIEWRKTLWNDSIGYVKERPIIGSGVGTANKLILEKRTEKMGSPDPHNDYLKISIESGLLGLFSYLILILTTLLYLIKSYFQTTKGKLKTVSLVIFALFFSLLVMSFADNVLRNTALQWALWSLIGGLMGIAHLKTRPKQSQIDKSGLTNHKL